MRKEKKARVRRLARRNRVEDGESTREKKPNSEITREQAT
jgi:hypothetical protein